MDGKDRRVKWLWWRGKEKSGGPGAEMRNEEEMVGGLVNKSIKPRAELTLNPYCGIGPGGGWGVDFAVHSKPCN
jgi:hypothetical protein